MLNKKPSFMGPDQIKEMESIIENADNLDASTTNLLTSIKYFLKAEQHKLRVKEPSVAAAEIQMKAFAAFFNERRDMMVTAQKQIEDTLVIINAFALKLDNSGHKAKGVRIHEASDSLTAKIEEITMLIEQITEAKKEQLEELRKKILKAERLRHFKNLQ